MKRGACLLLGATLVAGAQAQQSRPYVGNPLQTLPTPVPMAPTPSVRLSVQPQRNAQLQALLARTLVPTRFEIAGAHALPVTEMAKLFQPLAGHTVRVADLIAAADKVRALYEAHGYALSFAYIPAQSFAGGVVRVVVVEGYVAQVQIHGDAGSLEAKIRAITAHIQGERPLRTATFQRYVQLLGRLPGAHVDVNVPAPTTTDGATRLELNLTRTRFNLASSVDFNHPGVQGLLSATLNGLSPLGEKLTLSTLFPRGRGSQRYDAGSLAVPVGSDGMQLSLDGSRYDGRPDDSFQSLPDLSRRLTQHRLQLAASYPLQLAADHVQEIGGGTYRADVIDRYRNILTNAQLSLDSRVRVLFATFDDQRTSTRRSRKLSFAVAKGLNRWGAESVARSSLSDVPLAYPGDVAFTRYNASLEQADQWTARFGTRLSVAAQYSADTLPSTERITFGGARYALAYDPGEAAGDSGWGLSLELNRNWSVGKRYLKTLTPYVVAQVARVYVHQGHLPIDRLGSAGVGLRMSDDHHYAVDLTVAQPFGDRPLEASRRRPRINLGFSYQLR